MGGTVAKQYLPLQGTAVISHSVRTVLQTPDVVSVVIAISPDDTICRTVLHDAGINDERIHIVEGGEERQLSVKKALEHSSFGDADVVLVHDAVRPLATSDLFSLVAQEALEKGAVVPVVAVVDTIKEVVEGKVIRTLDRSDLRRVQTPQGFRTEVLRDAYAAPKEILVKCTDDASVVEASAGNVFTCPGEPWNLKLTKPDDMRVAERHLENVQ